MPNKKPSDKVKFGDPPPGRVARYDWAAIAEKLKDNPSEWALIFEQDLTSLVRAIRGSDIKALRKADGFEVRTANNRKYSPPICDLWMRWVPPKKGK